MRRETRSDAGGPRAVGQWIRRALPVTRLGAGPDRRRGPARGDDLGVRRARPVRRPSRCSRSGCSAFGRAAVRAVGAVDAAGPRDGPSFDGRPEGHRHAAQRPARLGRAARGRLAAAARAARRARRVLPRPPPPRPDRRRGSPGWRSPPCRCRWRGCGCGCSARPARSTRPTARSLPERFPLERGGIVALASAALAAALACWRRAVRARAPGGGRAPPPRSAPEQRPARPSGARRRRARGRDRRVAVRAGGASRGCSTRTPPACSSPPRTCGCSPPRAAGACGAALPALLAGLRPARCWRSCTSASRSASARTSWRGAPRSAPTAGAGLWSALLLGGAAGRARRASCACSLARRRIAREAGAGRGADPHARPGHLRRPGLARRHGVGAAAMSTAPAPRRRAAVGAARALDGADRLRHAAARRRRRDAAVAGAGVRRLLTAMQQGDLEDKLATLDQFRPSDVERRALESLPDPRRRLAFAARSLDRRTDEGDPLGRLRIDRIGISQVVRRGHRRRRPARRARPLRRHAAARPARHGRDRRPPHDLRRAVPAHRQGAPRATRSCS